MWARPCESIDINLLFSFVQMVDSFTARSIIVFFRSLHLIIIHFVISVNFTAGRPGSNRTGNVLVNLARKNKDSGENSQVAYLAGVQME
ncbi:hypothetical protein ACTXT7_003274 [Hymenolepis weldensis]